MLTQVCGGTRHQFRIYQLLLIPYHLSSKKIPIQGTNLVLDSPEAIDSWIAERKRRWPTMTRVEEKEKKIKEALDRGEISVSGTIARGRKRPRQDDAGTRGHLRGRVRGRRGHPGNQQPRTIHPLPKKPAAVPPTIANESGDESSSSGSDMDPEKDAISSKAPLGHKVVMEAEMTSEKVSHTISHTANIEFIAFKGRR